MRTQIKGNKLRDAIGLFLVLLGIGGILYVWYTNSSVSTINRTFSTYTILTGSWENYKKKFINQDGRVVDHSNNLTTSEGQSYAMLRAVWIDDKETFDSVWQFTKNNLQRDEDGLFGWKWGQLEGEEYGFIQPGGENSASDADTDIALALIFAARRWGDQEYRNQALQILEDLWEINTVEVQDKRYVLAGNWANGQEEIVLNPSYFAPYAYKIFAEEDKEREWLLLVDSSYEILERSSSEALGDQQGVGLPPNWVALNKETNALSTVETEGLGTEYSFDAMRVPFRIALDYQWFQEQRAKEYFENYLSILEEDYMRNGTLVAVYSHSGERMVEYESPAMYAMALGYFMNKNTELANEIYQHKVIEMYSNGVNAFNEDLPYYDQNLLWFGTALYNQQLILL